MNRRPANRIARIARAIVSLYPAPVLRQTGAGVLRGARTQPVRGAARTGRGWGRRLGAVRDRAEVRGCIALLGIGAVLLLLAILAGSYLLDRTVWRFGATAFPTPTRTPNIAALGPGPVLAAPSVDPATIRKVLASYGSPAVDEAQAFYDLGVERGIDPAYCLAFFIVESRAGTSGVATTTYSIGNIRARPGEPSYEGYRLYRSWREGIADWYRLIDELYVGEWGLTTIDAIVPIYAPRSDRNDPEAYARTVKWLVAGWRGL